MNLTEHEIINCQTIFQDLDTESKGVVDISLLK